MEQPIDVARALVLADKRFEAVVEQFGPPPERKAIKPALRFPQLCRAILHQQLAGSAAAAITGRVWALAGGPPTPEFLLNTDPELIRACGVSGAKLNSLLDLARHVESGAIALPKLARLDDATVIEQLVDVKGIGPWTAQMFLMSALARHDVWPILDFGVRAGWSTLTRHDGLIAPKALEAEGERFRPWRSSVAWYCWQIADDAKIKK
ncbi:MAG: hypothetical protein WCL38_07610 [Actinomycetota bacterium]